MNFKSFTLLISLACLVGAAAHAAPAAAPGNINDQANALFDQLFDAEVARSPMYQGYLGIKDNNDKWDDISDARLKQNHEFTKQQLKQLHTINVDKLDAATRLSYTLYEKKLSDDLAGYKWRYHGYPVNQMYGVHSEIPSFLINIHSIENEKGAHDYISRLRGTPVYIDQLIAALEVRKALKIIAPKFVFAHVIRDSKNVISGYPFAAFDGAASDGAAAPQDSTLLADFKGKLAALTLSDESKASLEQAAKEALVKGVGPAYKKLTAYLQDLEIHSDTRDGAWKFPKGEKFYDFALQQTTTTELSAKQIHKIGLDEVSRIHGEMRLIMKKLNFEGGLKAFLIFMREDPQFYYPQTEQGKQAYLEKATKIIDTMKGQLDQLFITKPKADLLVKAVEPFREKSAGKAFYEQPAPDGSRPGKYYANLYDMSSMPEYQMEALAYHEGIPGHHMQISIAQEIETMPKFRKYGRYTAYVEGWGLYSEFIPKEMGFYQDPYSDFGRLAMELWRACRLVVDTGIHAKKWTREQAIQYLLDNTPNSETDSIKAIERYIVMPSQATAYKIGMLKIIELREKAKRALGERFDLRGFHDVVLKNGPVPLDVLESLVDQWVKNSK